ncbi:MAG: PLP-dependent aminotransferase family protein [Lachnospiraceae bacterium]|nr:PLP-dependent aminotransferase family protein [Lachnospiraceae bacterium]
MLTYSFENKGSDTLYEYLYKQIKDDIVNYRLSPDEKLPSKRALAKNLNVSTITVENAYSQLMAEGYIYSVPKSGFYVSNVSMVKAGGANGNGVIKESSVGQNAYFADFVSNSIAGGSFPFATWTKLMREIMSDDTDKLMVRSPAAGVYELRAAIADYLYQFRGMAVEPEQIVVGAGTEYLYGLIIQLLGFDKKYAVEDPGYGKIARIYNANKVKCVHVPLDENGVNMEEIEKVQADILHISPSHHFPTGIVTPISRRYELLSWAAKSEGRYIIEDDFDSEFRLLGKPIPSLQCIDVLEKVIYINTFSKSLTSTIRISYMVLPKSLMKKYNEELSFYSCTVSNFEQYTLAAFIKKGFFEKHINRMRNYYRTERDTILCCIKNHRYYNRIEIKEEHAGLHFLLKADTDIPDEEIIRRAKENGIHISTLSQYFNNKENATEHILVINYSGINVKDINEALERLFDSIW